MNDPDIFRTTPAAGHWRAAAIGEPGPRRAVAPQGTGPYDARAHEQQRRPRAAHRADGSHPGGLRSGRCAPALPRARHPDLIARRQRDHEHIDTVLVSRVRAEEDQLEGRSLTDHLLAPLNRRATRRFPVEARTKVWRNAR